MAISCCARLTDLHSHRPAQVWLDRKTKGSISAMLGRVADFSFFAWIICKHAPQRSSWNYMIVRRLVFHIEIYIVMLYN